MFLFYVSFIFVFILILFIFLLGGSLSKKISFEREKMSPFECGFTPKFNARLPFSMRFFLISLVFLVFDVELVLMFPFIMSLSSKMVFFTIFGVSIFLVILFLGLLHEWNQGSLDWVN